jgi:hypothetical protein
MLLGKTQSIYYGQNLNILTISTWNDKLMDGYKFGTTTRLDAHVRPTWWHVRTPASAPPAAPVPLTPPFLKKSLSCLPGMQLCTCTSCMQLLHLQTCPCMLVRLRMQLCAACLLMPASCLLMRIQVGTATHADRICMCPLIMPANVATWKDLCNIHLKQVKHLPKYVYNICV